jgi:large conductance mechanosensitive channel
MILRLGNKGIKSGEKKKTHARRFHFFHEFECMYRILIIFETELKHIFMSILKDFRDFAMNGNVVDLAVGVIIGGAFGAIVNSLVGDILMPLIGVLSGGVDFSGLSMKVGEATLAYGKFIQAIITFTIIAFALFSIIKTMNSLKKKEAAAPAAIPVPTPEEQLLTEIRDLLKSQK